MVDEQMMFTEEEVKVSNAVALSNYKKQGVVPAFQAAAMLIMVCETLDQAQGQIAELANNIAKLTDEDARKVQELPGYGTYAEKMDVLIQNGR